MHSQILPLNEIAGLIRDVPDFPKPGILFKDITPILEHSQAFYSLSRHLAEAIDPSTTKLVAIESRGFILGAAVAQHMNAGLVLVRKPGKLPSATVSYSYELEYGTDTLEVHKDAVRPEDKVTIIDDVLATGGTAHAAETLCRKIGAQVLGFSFLMEIDFLKGGERLEAPYHSLIHV